ncbi:ATP-binding protein [Kitasatospora sp. NPDC085895]|uniref:ATP-binding protein n=1 Tax=Kitasatospora sp. NPDC085895 TaxID=3155057 RepID=UPI00344CF2C4
MASDRRRLDFLPGDQDACVSEGLAFTRAALTDWHLTTTAAQAAADAVLVTAELLANAAQHAGGPSTLHLQRSPGRLRIAVTDPDPAPPQPARPHRPQVPHGHGLIIVDRISTDWGHTPDDHGKTVWADLSVPADADTTARPDPGHARRAALADPDPHLDN